MNEASYCWRYWNCRVMRSITKPTLHPNRGSCYLDCHNVCSRCVRLFLWGKWGTGKAKHGVKYGTLNVLPLNAVPTITKGFVGVLKCISQTPLAHNFYFLQDINKFQHRTSNWSTGLLSNWSTTGLLNNWSTQ